MTTLLALRDWQTFYLLTGTAAATLIGLLFVAISISVGANLTVKEATNAIQTFVTPILLSYAQVLLVSCLGVMPLQSPQFLAIVLIVLGSGIMLHAAMVAWRILVLHHAEEADKGLWLWHVLFPFLAGILFVGTGIGFLRGDSWTFIALSIADLLCLTIGLRNSWSLTIWLVLYLKLADSASPEKEKKEADAVLLTN